MPPTQHHVLLRGAVAFFLPLFGSHFSPFSLHLYFISPTSEGQLFAGILPSQGQPEPGCRSNILDGRRMPHTHRRGEVSPTAPCVGLDGEKKKNCRDLLSQQASLLPRHYVLKIFQLIPTNEQSNYTRLLCCCIPTPVSLATSSATKGKQINSLIKHSTDKKRGLGLNILLKKIKNT